MRVDANGGFAFAKPSSQGSRSKGERSVNAKEILMLLADFDIHSIEQPIATGNWQEMAELCEASPTPIALDEELIGVTNPAKKRELLESIRPQYIILKPSFIGGFRGAQEWINLADELEIGWWITSALESNIGLNAIAQWTSIIGAKGPQGLGTGSLYTNNIPAPLEVKNGTLHCNPNLHWDFKF